MKKFFYLCIFVGLQRLGNLRLARCHLGVIPRMIYPASLAPTDTLPKPCKEGRRNPLLDGRDASGLLNELKAMPGRSDNCDPPHPVSMLPRLRARGVSIVLALVPSSSLATAAAAPSPAFLL